jgi:nitrite reductase/ring-hydroxylating ferredoxin subunit
MLTKEENELLTQTGPDTPCGDFMRRYWTPVALSEELVPDGPPVAVKVLGEDLVLFRDGQGQLGLIGRWCAHRGTDLRFGDVEEAGVRCAYHGWLYDVHGSCLEMPLEPDDTELRAQVQQKAYRCQEHAGLIFGYLGPGEPPLLPNYEFLTVPAEQRRSTKYYQECNYLQAHEGNLDPTQRLLLEQLAERQGQEGFVGEIEDFELTMEPEETDFGARVFTTRPADDGKLAVDVRSYLLPSLSAVAATGYDGYTVQWHVPMDDTHHWRYVVTFRRDGPITDEEARRNGVEPAEGYKLDLDRARAFFQGKEPLDENFVIYSAALAESQGPTYDRTLEHLGESDNGIVAMRTIMFWAIQDVLEGSDPPHVVRAPEANHFSHVVVKSDVVPSTEDWRVSWHGDTTSAQGV